MIPEYNPEDVDVKVFTNIDGKDVLIGEGQTASFVGEPIEITGALNHFSNPFTIDLASAHVDGTVLAYMLDVEDDKEISRLIKLHDKAKKKRIKKKLNKRILSEISILLVTGEAYL